MSYQTSTSSTQIYQLNKLDKGYSFVTTNGIEYTTYFLSGADYISNQPFSHLISVFGFASNYQGKCNYDPNIESTIIFLLKDFLKDNHNILLFSCDQKDSRQRHGKIVFNKWFNNNKNGSYVKHDICIEDTLYISLIFKTDNPFEKEIVKSKELLENDMK